MVYAEQCFQAAVSVMRNALGEKPLLRHRQPENGLGGVR